MMRLRRRKNRSIQRKLLFLLVILICVPIGGWAYMNFIGDGQASVTKKNVGKEESNIRKPSVPVKGNGEAKINDILSQMTLKEKIGQLMVVGFQNHFVDAHMKEMIEQYKVGGVIYYDRNMVNPSQVGRLTKDLQALAMKSPLQIPLMVSVDQEGGIVMRMKDQVSPIPSQKELGQKGNANEVLNLATRTGKELLNMGINVNFAPVLDLSETDTRSFGLDPNKAGLLGEQVVNGLVKSGVAATLKHFPGNGKSNIDPHHETSSVGADKSDLESKDIYPFKKIIDELDDNQFFVMVTHIKYPAYDSENPASTSPKIIKDLLKKQLGFQGIVVTDDLEMGAVSKYISYRDLGVMSIQAGADLLLVCHTPEYQKEVYNGILDAVKTKKLSEQQIDEAVKRVLRYKLKN
jgi:beta-N-acetylhexosaminidase